MKIFFLFWKTIEFSILFRFGLFISSFNSNSSEFHPIEARHEGQPLKLRDT